MKKSLCFLAVLSLLCFVFPGAAEGSGPVYVLGNFAFGMTFASVRAMDRNNHGRIEVDPERDLQCFSLLSDNFIVSLWFDGLQEDAPLIEMDFAFFGGSDSVYLGDKNRLKVQTSGLTVSAVYSYVENLCRKNFGKGKSAPDGGLPFSSLLLEDEALSRLRIYTIPDSGKTDIIVHFIAAEAYPVNYLICRQAESTK